MSTAHQEISKLLMSREAAFNNIAEKSKATVKFESECVFARQQLLKNDFSVKTATNNPQSLLNAITNVAAIGLTLNPANSYAYLVPRDGQIILDVSYRGLFRLATDSGVIKWVKAELVYSQDNFELQELNMPPVHKHDPFASIDQRGEFMGVYCVVKTVDGDYLTETMSAEDVYKIRGLSMAYTRGNGNSVWDKHFDQMAIKTVVKRASKLWPASNGKSDRLIKAVDLLNEQEGSEPIAQPVHELKPIASPELRQAYIDAVEANDGVAVYHIAQSHDNATQADLVGAWTKLAPKGKKGEYGQRHHSIFDAGREVFVTACDQLSEAMNKDDIPTAMEILQEFENERTTLLKVLDNDYTQVKEWCIEILQSEEAA